MTTKIERNTMEKMYTEMEKRLDRLNGWGSREMEEKVCEETCERCSLRERCATEKLYWGCGVWEVSMGEDL